MMYPIKPNYVHYPSQTFEYESQPIQHTPLVSVPQNPIQYTPVSPPTQYYPVQYVNQKNHHISPNVQIQQSIEYPTQYSTSVHNKYSSLSPPSQQVSLTLDNGNHLNSYGPSLDFFGTQSKHSSLLDSYIPSSVILERQKALHNARPVLSLSSYNNNGASSNNNLLYSNGYSGYNTIAYSVPHKYDSSKNFKRSTPKTTTILQQSSKTTKLKKSV